MADRLELLAEAEQLRARLADAEGEGCTLHKHAPHGKEAEELRSGLERLLVDGTGFAHYPDRLRKLLDRVDARDSLAHLRANEELRDARKALQRAQRMLLRVNDVLAEAWVDHLDATDGVPRHLKDAFRALGVKLSSLPKPIPPAGRGRRG